MQGVTPCREPWHLSCHGGLGDKSAGNVRPVAERFQSAILICIALHAFGVQSGVQGYYPCLPCLVEGHVGGEGFGEVVEIDVGVVAPLALELVL